MVATAEERAGVRLTNLDQPLFADSGSTKRELVDYLDAVRDRLLPALADRPLSVVRVLRGQAPFMQKNVPKYTPDFVPTVSVWAEASKRMIAYALCGDRATLLWFGNQRAVEYHVTLVRADGWERQTHLVLDLDPPPDAGFDVVVRTAHVVRAALEAQGLTGAVKTSGAKGVHVVVPLDETAPIADVAAATRALAARAEQLAPELATTAYVKDERGGKVFLDSTRSGGATVAAVYSPRVRPGTPVSWPVPWEDLDAVRPGDFTIHTVPALLAATPPWTELLPPPQHLDADLIAAGHEIPIARVQAMHEGKRRKRAQSGG